MQNNDVIGLLDREGFLHPDDGGLGRGSEFDEGHAPLEGGGGEGACHHTHRKMREEVHLQ